MATVTLNGSKSTDPDRDALGFTWAWAIGANAYLSNGVSLTIELPVGVHTVQLMVNDGHVSSPPAAVNVTVVAPLECQLKIAPSAINLNSEGSHILASIRFPDGITGDDADNDAPLLLYPGGIQPVNRWTAGGPDGEAGTLFAFFDRDEVAAQVPDGSAELMVVGTLRSGQVFYGKDTVKIIGKDKKH